MKSVFRSKTKQPRIRFSFPSVFFFLATLECCVNARSPVAIPSKTDVDWGRVRSQNSSECGGILEANYGFIDFRSPLRPTERRTCVWRVSAQPNPGSKSCNQPKIVVTLMSTISTVFGHKGVHLSVGYFDNNKMQWASVIRSKIKSTTKQDYLLSLAKRSRSSAAGNTGTHKRFLKDPRICIRDSAALIHFTSDRTHPGAGFHFRYQITCSSGGDDSNSCAPEILKTRSQQNRGMPIFWKNLTERHSKSSWPALLNSGSNFPPGLFSGPDLPSIAPLFFIYLHSYKKEINSKNPASSERLQIFQDNLIKISDHNRNEGRTNSMGLNMFTDLIDTEFLKKYTLSKGPKPPLSSNSSSRRVKRSTVPLPQAPESWDWRNPDPRVWGHLQVVSPVEHQGNCGSCYAFASISVVESAYTIDRIQNGAQMNVPSLSAQQVVDCTTNWGNLGCNGGWSSNSFDYIKTHGIYEKNVYDYTGIDGNCRVFNDDPVARVTSSWQVPADEEVLKQYVYNYGPATVQFRVTGFQRFVDSGNAIYYNSDSVNNPDCIPEPPEDPDYGWHVMVVVGYGSVGGLLPYWIVRNSWGDRWHDNGYIKVLRGRNTCGIRNYAFQAQATRFT